MAAKLPSNHRVIGTGHVGGQQVEICSNRKGNQWWRVQRSEGWFTPPEIKGTRSKDKRDAWLAELTK